MATYTSIPSISRTQGWVERISKIFTKEVAIQIDHLPPVSIFEIPRVVSDKKPEAFTPQLIALGPYHHLRPELYQMERYKLSAIKEITSSPEQMFSFEQLVIHRLKEIDPTTRACYNKFMDYDQDTLAWIMAIDGCFILNFLRSYLVSDNATDRMVFANTIITRDIMMLENQIPYIHLKEIRRCLGLSSSDVEQDRELFYMMLDFCEGQSPVTLTIDRTRCNTTRRPHHLLDLMYFLIVNGPDCLVIPNDDQLPDFPLYGTDFTRSSISSSSSSSINEEQEEEKEVENNVGTILEVVESFGLGNKSTQGILNPVKVVSNIPWSRVSGLFRKGSQNHGAGGVHNDSLANEMPIPSVSHLWRHARVKCVPISGGINEIQFVEKEAALHLPTLNLNASSEVILRNLVAYEAAMSYSTLEFARYINLMNGIVDTAEDVKLLRQNGVIKGALTDKEVAEHLNGMKRSYVRVNERSNIEIAIEMVNKYYNDQVVVRIIGWMKKKLKASWKQLAIFSTVMLFILLSVQSFCDIYACHRFWDGN